MTLPTPPRTYKMRRGRITAHQAEGLQRLWPEYGVELSAEPLDVKARFGRVAPLILEIGFGMGEATLAMAAADPARDVLAVDVHTPGVGKLLRGIESAGLRNVRVIEGDALQVLRLMLEGVELDEVRAFFPDPWPKHRHLKRRLVSPAFLDLLALRLRAGGVFHVATDSPVYAAHAQRVLEAHTDFTVAVVHERPAHRPVTRFEQQAIDAGRDSVDLLALRR